MKVPLKFRSPTTRAKLEIVLEQVRVAGPDGVDVVAVSTGNQLSTIQANEYLNCLIGLGFVVRRAVPVKKGLRSTKSTAFRFSFNKDGKKGNFG